MLVDEGRLDLDCPVGELLPPLRQLRLADGTPPQRPPTVRDLLRHTSGLAYPWEIADVPTRTPESDALSKALQKEGFKFVGSTICYAFMQASGMVDDHVAGCHCH